MSKIKTFIEDRNEVFASGDIDKIKAYCRKYKIEIPEDEVLIDIIPNKFIFIRRYSCNT